MATETKVKWTRLEIDMFRAMRDLLGEGYVPDYYRGEAGPFIQIAEGHMREAVELLRAWYKPKRNSNVVLKTAKLLAEIEGGEDQA